MAIVCPTILADNPRVFREQMERVMPFAKRIQIDVSDGEFSPVKTVGLTHLWWPKRIPTDIHLMYQRPMDELKQLIKLRPNMVIVHAEADGNLMHFAAELHREEIKTGLAILPGTTPEKIDDLISSFDHLLIFSGDLGRFGGKADLGLLDKVKQISSHHPDLEFGWDGGINDENVRALAEGSIDVLNVGGYIQRADNPNQAYLRLVGKLHTGS